MTWPGLANEAVIEFSADLAEQGLVGGRHRPSKSRLAAFSRRSCARRRRSRIAATPGGDGARRRERWPRFRLTRFSAISRAAPDAGTLMLEAMIEGGLR
jgi:hypothetical protein